MTPTGRVTRRVGATLVLAVMLGACGSPGPSTTTTTREVVSPTATALSLPQQPSTTPAPHAAGELANGTAYRSEVPRSCHLSGTGAWVLPDARCTPGALNPAVNPTTIDTTICVSGYSTSIRPPQSFTYDLKRSQMAAWGLQGSTIQTEEDHLVPLSLGGAPSDSANLWPEPGGIPNPKDRLEYRLYRMVCDHELDLRSAQRAIATDWIAAYRRFIGPTSGS